MLTGLYDMPEVCANDCAYLVRRILYSAPLASSVEVLPRHQLYVSERKFDPAP